MIFESRYSWNWISLAYRGWGKNCCSTPDASIRYPFAQAGSWMIIATHRIDDLSNFPGHGLNKSVTATDFQTSCLGVSFLIQFWQGPNGAKITKKYMLEAPCKYLYFDTKT